MSSIREELVVLTVLPTWVELLLALNSMTLFVVMQTTMNRPNMTAYSTAIGLSSLRRQARHRRKASDTEDPAVLDE